MSFVMFGSYMHIPSTMIDNLKQCDTKPFIITLEDTFSINTVCCFYSY